MSYGTDCTGSTTNPISGDAEGAGKAGTNRKAPRH